MPTMQADPPVVILGGGFGGVFTAYHLTAAAPRRHRQRATLLSKDETFLFKPLMPEAVGSAARTEHLLTDLRDLSRRWQFGFTQTEVLEVDPERQVVMTADGPLEYSDLVVALGSVVHDHGLDLSAPNILPLHGAGDDVRLRHHVEEAVERALRATDDGTRRHLLSFVCVGAGPTGVETMCEVQALVMRCLAQEHATHLGTVARFTLIEAAPDILPTLSEPLREDVRVVLKRRRIRVECGVPVAEVTNGLCRLADGEEHDAGTLVWAAGIRAHPFVTQLGAPCDQMGRVRVDNYLRPRGLVNVFALGDCACALDAKTGAPLGATGQVAVQQAKTVAENVILRRQGRPLKVFNYAELGQLVPLGAGEAAGSVFGRVVRGRTAWLASRAAYVRNIFGMDNRLGLAAAWGREAMTSAVLRPLWSGRL